MLAVDGLGLEAQASGGAAGEEDIEMGILMLAPATLNDLSTDPMKPARRGK
jgi:hypothetical protein